eukprot:12886264-Prorocentrum_lima.AAC.1
MFLQFMKRLMQDVWLAKKLTDEEKPAVMRDLLLHLARGHQNRKTHHQLRNNDHNSPGNKCSQHQAHHQ